MKITGIETYRLRCEIPAGWRFPVASFVSGGSLLVKVLTDEGIVGWGEPSPYGALPETTRDLLESELRERFLGRNPEEVGRLTVQDELRGEPVYGKAGWNAALAGLSQALWDIVGKARGLPVYRLLDRDGRARTRVPAYASGGMYFEDSPREWLIEEALKARDEGYAAWKFRPPTPRGGGSHFQRSLAPPAFDVDRLIAASLELRKALGDGFDLMLDAGCRASSAEEAIRLGQRLGELGFAFFEEPSPRDPALYRLLADRLEVPVATGECFFSEGQFRSWLEAGAVDVLQPDANFAGITEILAIAQLAGGAGKPLVLHNWASAVSVAANVQLAAALPGCTRVEFNTTFNPLRTELVREPLVPKRGFFELTEKPGLGIEIDERALRKYRG